VLNVIGEKLAKEMVIPPSIGMWLSCIVLLPLALFLTYKANNDSVIFRGEWYGNITSGIAHQLKKLFRKKSAA
jgi:lipopolysaccharide export system permease protein